MVVVCVCADRRSDGDACCHVTPPLLHRVQVAVDDRLKLLQEAHRDFGPASQHFLSSE